jgi:endogenous inhibitor of DNA gyrase (YacG/DUF329 family)
MGMPITVTCTVCGTEFSRPPSRIARVKTPSCSQRCKGILRGQAWATYGHLGAKARTPESYAKAAMRGPKNPAWKGGVTYWRKKGKYPPIKYVRAPAWALPMARADGYLMEHRMLMAQMVGRLLTRTEVVHHLDHDPLNNTPTNLELWPSNGSHKAAEHGRVVPGAANRWLPRSSADPSFGTTEVDFLSPWT